MGSYTKILEVKKETQDVDKSKYTTSEEADSITFEAGETLEQGSYKLIAKTSKGETELATQEFTKGE